MKKLKNKTPTAMKKFIAAEYKKKKKFEFFELAEYETMTWKEGMDNKCEGLAMHRPLYSDITDWCAGIGLLSILIAAIYGLCADNFFLSFVTNVEWIISGILLLFVTEILSYYILKNTKKKNPGKRIRIDTWNSLGLKLIQLPVTITVALLSTLFFTRMQIHITYLLYTVLGIIVVGGFIKLNNYWHNKWLK